MLENLLERVNILEVGLRDGLQNEAASIATADKLTFIHKLLQAGVRGIEVTSFVRPERVPQMADGGELLARLLEGDASKLQGRTFPVLVPNFEGVKNALEAGARHFSLITATSDTFSQKNANATVTESLQRISRILNHLNHSTAAPPAPCQVRAYISTVFGCPYEGDISTAQVLGVVEKLLGMGIREIVLGDTIGVATPGQVNGLLMELAQVMEMGNLALHFHDTRGMALANILWG